MPVSLSIETSCIDLRGLDSLARYNPGDEYGRVLREVNRGGWSWMHPSQGPTGLVVAVRVKENPCP